MTSFIARPITAGLPTLRVHWVALLAFLPLAGALGYFAYAGVAHLAGEAPAEPFWFAGIFAATYLGLGAIHELGHVAAGLSLGLKWTEITVLPAAMGITLEHPAGAARTNAQQAVISISGPAVSAAVALVIVSGSDQWSALWVAAWCALIDTAFNLLPLAVGTHHCDGRKVIDALGQGLTHGFSGSFREPQPAPAQTCGQCWNCVEHPGIGMILCPDCGNKRCPKAQDCANACTASNEPGQPGAHRYPAFQEVTP